MTHPPSSRGRRFFQFPRRTRGQIASEVNEELRFHLDRVAEDLMTAGWGAAEARQEAARRFGDLSYTSQYCRDEDARRESEKRRMTFLEELRQDLRYAIRSLRAAPAFTAVALLTLALGIGANTAIFSVVRGVLLEPLPFAASDEIVRVYHARPADGIDRGAVSEPDFLDWQAESRRARSMGAFFFADGLVGMDLTGRGNPERLSAALVTDGFFQTLGTAPHLGRAFTPDEQVPGRDRAVVLSHGFWTRRFGADSALVGGTLILNDEPFLVVGVMPPAFTYPAAQQIDAWIPLSVFGPEQIGRARGVHFLSVIARRAPGVSDAELDAEISGIAARLSREYDDNPGWTDAATQRLRETMLGGARRPLVLLMAAVAMLLIIACANIANLMFARATVRQRELAVRAALGAGRGRIARQLLTESLTLAGLGGALGVILGIVGVRALVGLGASELPRASGIKVDGTVLAFTVLVSVTAGMLFGLAPSIRASSAKLAGALRSGARGSVGSAGQRLRSGLVVLEVALAVVLVVGAGLATKSFARLISVDPGFVPQGALVVEMNVPDRFESRDARLLYYQQVLEGIRAVPGVQAAGSVRDLPLRGNGEGVRVGTAERPAAPGEGTRAQLHQISTDYFRALGAPLRAGRAFANTDHASAPPVVVVNEELARLLWPGQPVADVVGRIIPLGPAELTVVGVVGNIHQHSLAEAPQPAMYLHALQNFRSRMSIVVRTSGDPLAHTENVKNAIWSLEPNQTITSTATLASVLGSEVARPRLLAWLLALFGFIGLTLGALGIFGVLAFAVNQRRQEIGVRVALGATPRTVLALVVGRGMLLALAGVAVGLAAAALATRSMQSVLYGIETSDPLTFLQVVLVLLAAALLASWIPARRALGIDPMTALRYD